MRRQGDREVCERGYDAQRGTFTQYYGSCELDASVLLIPAVGFLPANDPRVLATIATVQSELTANGLVQRYSTDHSNDGLPGSEGAFLPCSFWLVDALFLAGRGREANELFTHLLSLHNDVGLLSEAYDTTNQRLVGNFPQAFTHLQLIKSARRLTDRVASASATRVPVEAAPGSLSARV